METKHDYLKRLRDLGIKELGEGANAAVFQHPYYKNVVVRIFSHTDYGYMSWMKFIKAHPNNRYVPQIIPNEQGTLFYKTTVLYSATYFKKYTRSLYFVFLKKYQPLTTVMTLKGLTRQLLQYTNFHYSAKNRLDSYPTAYIFKNIVDNPKFRQDWGDDAVEVIRFLSKTDRLDLHTENIMWDAKNKNIVFTDPIG
jgi:hypothetical protein